MLGTAGVTTLPLEPATPGVVSGVAGFAPSEAVFSPGGAARPMDVSLDASVGDDLGASRTVSIGTGTPGLACVGFVGGRSGSPAAFEGPVVALLASWFVRLGSHLTRFAPDRVTTRERARETPTRTGLFTVGLTKAGVDTR